MGDFAQTPLFEEVQMRHDLFVDGLVKAGFRLTCLEQTACGPRATLKNSRVRVSIPEGFPYLPPKVHPLVETQWSWHRESNGDLCLYAAHHRDTRPWTDVKDFLSQVDDWFHNNDNGWPEDVPVLDLDSYLPLERDERFVRYPTLTDLSKPFFVVKPHLSGHQLLVEKGKKVGKRSKGPAFNGYLTDLGEVTKPPRSWDDLIALAPDRAKIRSQIDVNRIGLVMFAYRRKGLEGVLIITLSRQRDGSLTYKSALGGCVGAATLQRRAEPMFSDLSVKRVHVIGAGALGSHICDGLVRAGVGRLSIQDFDILTPGNLVRHAVTSLEYCGLRKPEALRHWLKAKPYNGTEIIPLTEALLTPEQAHTPVSGEALVVDATADDAVTLMLEDAARATGKSIVTVCVQNEGRDVRVDVVPPMNGAAPLPATVQKPRTQPDVFEDGCNEPLSIAPPHAVREGASLAVRQIVTLLTDPSQVGAGDARALGA